MSSSSRCAWPSATSAALLVVGYASVAAYVGGQLWAAADAGGPAAALPFDARWLGAPAAAAAAAEGARVLRAAAEEGKGAERRGWGKGRYYALWATAAAAAAAWAGVLRAFGAAYVLTLWLLAAIDAAGRRGLVRYDHSGVGFFATRCTLYASGRAAAAAATARLGLPLPAARLAWFWAATAETAFMAIVGNRSYAFSARGADFAAYALLKSALFLAAPLAEEALVRLAEGEGQTAS